MERLINGGSTIIPGQAGHSTDGCHSLGVSGPHFRYELRQSNQNLQVSTKPLIKASVLWKHENILTTGPRFLQERLCPKESVLDTGLQWGTMHHGFSGRSWL